MDYSIQGRLPSHNLWGSWEVEQGKKGKQVKTIQIYFAFWELNFEKVNAKTITKWDQGSSSQDLTGHLTPGFHGFTQKILFHASLRRYNMIYASTPKWEKLTMKLWGLWRLPTGLCGPSKVAPQTKRSLSLSFWAIFALKAKLCLSLRALFDLMPKIGSFKEI